MPDYYSSIGEAVGAAMAHNIKLAYRGAIGPDLPPPVTDRPRPAADPHSVPGLIARLGETATPEEVASVLEDVNGALDGVLPQLSEIVVAAADWTRLRLTALGEPHRELVFETWTRLAAAHGLIHDVQENLEAAQDLITAIPGDLRDPRCLDEIPALRTHEQPNDVLGHDSAPDDEPSTNPNAAADRQRAARSSSPQASAHRTAASGPPPTGSPTPPPASPRRSR